MAQSGAGKRTVERLRITVRGAVQGAVFRPHVRELARELSVGGWVRDSGDGVHIEAEASGGELDRFIERLRTETPADSRISVILSRKIKPVGDDVFEIRESSDSRREALSLPDVSICPECLAEIRNPSDRRYRYPFTTCANCGPRFSVLTGAPYTRAQTTMRGFAMCDECRAEYERPADRRHGNELNACPECGPELAALLPYTPLLHLIAEGAGRPLVITTGNVSREPACIDEREAFDRLGGIADAFLVHDQPIARPVADSLVRVLFREPQVLRRSHGYAPEPVTIARDGRPLLAVGAQRTGTVALVEGRDV
ncbi:MAG: Carbamoyltransferase HypF [Calditrichaeota bacterium]|nr:Carbamoyltransferase HypF [Calditrichota bacterium]